MLTNLQCVRQVIYWDEKAVYMEQRFITIRDGFIRAVAMHKQVVPSANVEQIVDGLSEGKAVKPEISEELQFWMNSLDASSKKLRPSLKF